MERVYKNILGYKSENEKNKATHVILTLEELDSLESEIKGLNTSLDKNTLYYKGELEKEINNTNKCVQKEINNTKLVQNKLNVSIDEIKRLNNLNENLLRIAKERANASRNLRPKKKNFGYALLKNSSFSYLVRVKESKKYIIHELPCWKVEIQSPYDSTIPYKVIKKDIDNDFKIVMEKLNIDEQLEKYNNLEQDEFEKILNIWNSDKCFMFKKNYRQNFHCKSMFWEVEFLVSNIINIPDEMIKR